MTGSVGLKEFLEGERQRIERALEASLPAGRPGEPWLSEAMGYSLLEGGKRLRGVLALHTCEVLGGPAERVLPAACALEMVHAYSLIHDDLPALDDDDVRRGRPSSHVAFGEALAILAGDGLAALAFVHLASATPDPALVGRLTRELADGTMDMIFGQVADIHWEGQAAPEEALRSIHEQKTAALFRTAVRIGALAAGAGGDALDRFTTYGRSIGLAFQIVDDLLDVVSSTEQLGKRAGKDAERGKNTYPACFGVERSREEATRLVDEAVGAVAEVPGSGRLVELARYIVDRTT